jgi:hypothetical protein
MSQFQWLSDSQWLLIEDVLPVRRWSGSIPNTASQSRQIADSTVSDPVTAANVLSNQGRIRKCEFEPSMLCTLPTRQRPI